MHKKQNYLLFTCYSLLVFIIRGLYIFFWVTAAGFELFRSRLGMKISRPMMV